MPPPVAQPAGSLPWVTLGLGAADSWGNRYEYWLDANNFANILNPPFTLSTNADANGQIMTRSADGTVLIPLANNVVAVVVSRGKNGLGGIGADGFAKVAIPATGHSDEVENSNGDNIFVSRPLTSENNTTNVGIFDDVVIWISEYELKAKMVEAGVLP